ncbi:MAG: hypothetical protein HXY30_02575 [Pseudorhodoplanes sp.]|nr:hypothetical protein [Pseudorhodoplanes sp.]
MRQFTFKAARTLMLAAVSFAAVCAISAPASAMPKGMSGIMSSMMENESVKGMMSDFAESDLGKSLQQMQGKQGRKGKGGGLGGIGSMLGGQGGGMDSLQGLGGSLGLD